MPKSNCHNDGLKYKRHGDRQKKSQRTGNMMNKYLPAQAKLRGRYRMYPAGALAHSLRPPFFPFVEEQPPVVSKIPSTDNRNEDQEDTSYCAQDIKSGIPDYAHVSGLQSRSIEEPYLKAR